MAEQILVDYHYSTALASKPTVRLAGRSQCPRLNINKMRKFCVRNGGKASVQVKIINRLLTFSFVVCAGV